MPRPTSLNPACSVPLALAGATVGAAVWWRRNPSAMPYWMHFVVDPPHPIITSGRLRAVLAPRPGERLLEIGPGTGYYSLPVAEWLTPGGRLDIFDIQREMLDHTMRRADERGLDNLVPTEGDARALPYPDATFDGVYLATVLGEIPDQDAALREIARVLRPGGRLVNGELFGDPHWVRPRRLTEGAARAGLRAAGRSGTPLAYFARFERPEG